MWGSIDDRLRRLAARLDEALLTGLAGDRISVPVRIPDVGRMAFYLHDKPDIWISDVIRKGDLFDWQVMTLLKLLTNLGDTFLDIGANIGWFSVIGSRLVSERGAVIAVEPDPDNYRLLQLNVLGNRCTNVTSLAVAAGASSGVASLSRSPDNQGDHRLEISTDRSDIVPVPVRRLDDFIGPGDGFRPINVIKIDTQGSETAVIKGLSATLADSPLARIVLEYWPYGLERCGSSARELIDVLERESFLLWRIQPDASLRSMSSDDLLALAEGPLHPDSQHFADLVAVSATDLDGVSLMRSREA